MKILCWLGFHDWIEWDDEKEHYGKYVCLRCWKIKWYFFKAKALQEIRKLTNEKSTNK